MPNFFLVITLHAGNCHILKVLGVTWVHFINGLNKWGIKSACVSLCEKDKGQIELKDGDTGPGVMAASRQLKQGG